MGIAQRVFHNAGQVLTRSCGVSGNVADLVEVEDKIDHVAG